jgi:ketosteroid isomerase-like protein
MPSGQVRLAVVPMSVGENCRETARHVTRSQEEARMLRQRWSVALAFALATLPSGCATRTPVSDMVAETASIDSVIRENIQWAIRKDTAQLYRTVAHDSTLFWFSPDSTGTVSGFPAFRRQVEGLFMNPAFVAVGSAFRDMRIHLSRSGDVAWWSCILDDRNTWQGRPANWENVRWTGVLERRDGRWVIVQMHFSHSEEAMARALRPPGTAPRTR